MCLLRLRRGVTSVIFLASWKTLLPKSPPHANERSSVPLFGVLVAKVKTSVHCFQFTRTYTTTTTLANEKVQDSFFFFFYCLLPFCSYAHRASKQSNWRTVFCVCASKSAPLPPKTPLAMPDHLLAMIAGVHQLDCLPTFSCAMCWTPLQSTVRNTMREMDAVAHSACVHPSSIFRLLYTASRPACGWRLWMGLPLLHSGETYIYYPSRSFNGPHERTPPSG